jgi:hypothetical protein
LLAGFFNITTYLFAGHVGLFTLSCSEIAYGFYLNRICKENAKLNSKTLRVVIILLFINTLAIPISQFFVATYTQNQKEITTNTTPTPTITDPTANWKTYTYKNIFLLLLPFAISYS